MAGLSERWTKSVFVPFGHHAAIAGIGPEMIYRHRAYRSAIEWLQWARKWMDGNGAQHGQAGGYQQPRYYPFPQPPPQQPQHWTQSPSLYIAIFTLVLGVIVAATQGWFSQVNGQMYDTPQKIAELQMGLNSVKEKQVQTDAQIAQLRDAVNNSNIRQAEATAKIDSLSKQQTDLSNYLGSRFDNLSRSTQELRSSIDRLARNGAMSLEPGEDLIRPQGFERPAIWRQDVHNWRHRAVVRGVGP